ncbi:unnamed protein product [Discula destructiva]
MGSTSAATANPTPLAHPQPLPRQANHILAGTVPPAAGSNNRSAQVQQQNQSGGSIPGALNLSQQLLANLPKRPDVLDKDHLALLSAFKKDASSANGATFKTQVTQSSAVEDLRPTHHHQQQQQQHLVNATGLGSPYAGASRAHLTGQSGVQEMPVSHVSPQLAMAQAALRPRKVTPSQQHTLLSLLNQPSTSLTRVESGRSGLKENGAPHSSNQVLNTQLQSASFKPKMEATPSMLQNPMQGNNLPQMPHGAQRIAVRPKNVEQRTPKQQSVSQSTQQLGAFRVDGASFDSRSQTMGSPLTAYAGGSPYNNPVSPAQVGLHTPLPRTQEATPQRQQALLSLFGKSPAAACRDEERRPTPSSQTPISPANEKFLLDYLNGVTDSAK